MNLSYSISPDRRTLTIHADEAARKELADMGEAIHTDATMFDAFERLIANSELEWVSPEVCGDLTDAPIVGILGDEMPCADPDNGSGFVLSGHDGSDTLARPVLERWWFPAYQVQSVLAALRDTGQAIFTAP